MKSKETKALIVVWAEREKLLGLNEEYIRLLFGVIETFQHTDVVGCISLWLYQIPLNTFEKQVK